MVVRLTKIGRAADLSVHPSATQFLRIDGLADRGLDQGRTGQIQLAPFGDQQGVGKHRQIGPPGHAIAHHGGVLRNAHRGEDGVVAEDPSEVVLVGKDLVLKRQEHPGGIDQVDQRQPERHGDPLGAEHLLHGLRKEGPGLDGRIVGDHHHLPSMNASDERHDPGGRDLAPVGIHVPGRPQSQLEPRGPLVQQLAQTFASRQPPKLPLPLPPRLASPLADYCFLGLEIVRQLGKRRRSPLRRHAASVHDHRTPKEGFFDSFLDSWELYAGSADR